MLTEIALSIETTSVGGDQQSSVVLDRLHGLGGQMVSWTPELNGHPARALFKFENQVRRDRFLAEALVIPGIKQII